MLQVQVTVQVYKINSVRIVDGVRVGLRPYARILLKHDDLRIADAAIERAHDVGATISVDVTNRQVLTAIGLAAHGSFKARRVEGDAATTDEIIESAQKRCWQHRRDRHSLRRYPYRRRLPDRRPRPRGSSAHWQSNCPSQIPRCRYFRTNIDRQMSVVAIRSVSPSLSRSVEVTALTSGKEICSTLAFVLSLKYGASLIALIVMLTVSVTVNSSSRDRSDFVDGQELDYRSGFHRSCRQSRSPFRHLLHVRCRYQCHCRTRSGRCL